MVRKCHIGQLWSCTGGRGKSRIAHDQGEMEDSARTTVNQQQRTHEKSRYIPHTVLKWFDPPGSMHSRRHDSATDGRITQQRRPRSSKRRKHARAMAKDRRFSCGITTPTSTAPSGTQTVRTAPCFRSRAVADPRGTRLGSVRRSISALSFTTDTKGHGGRFLNAP